MVFLNGMDLLKKELSFFLEVAKKRSLTEASLTLDLSQSYLSKVISKLEKKLGEKLFFRSKKGVDLTPFGRTFFLKLSKVQKFAASFPAHDEKGQSIRGNYLLGIHPVIAHFTAPLFLGKILSENDELSFSFIFEESRIVTRKIVNGEVDFGIAVNAKKHPDLVIKNIGKESTYVFCPPKRKNQILFYNPKMLSINSHLKKIEGFTRIIAIESYELMAKLIFENCGYGILPENIAKTYKLPKKKPQALMTVGIDLIFRYELSLDQEFKKILKYLK